MQKIIITRGIPASGKTTWAKQYQKKHPEYKRLNRDDLRMMIDDGEWSKDREYLIVDARNMLIQLCIDQGYSVIVDDTNLAPNAYAKLMGELEALLEYFPELEIETKEFDTPVQECVDRDIKRTGKARVGEKVIMRFYHDYIKNQNK